MKVKSVIILSLLCVIFSGCVRNVTTQGKMENSTTSSSIDETQSHTEEYDFNTIEKSDIQSELVYSMTDIEIPEYAALTDFCVYGNLVYYSYSYLDYIHYGDADKITDTCKNRICVYDMETKKSEIIYTVPTDMEYVSNLSCSEKWLMFTQDTYGTENKSKLFLMDLSQDLLQTISVLSETDFLKAKLVDNYIVYISPGSEFKYNSIYLYDYRTDKTVELIKNVNANTFELNYIEDLITICNEQEDGSFSIKAYDLNGNLINCYETEMQIPKAKCNSSCVVWQQNQMLFYYDFTSKEKYCLGYATEFMLINNNIISVNNEGIYSYQLGDTSQKYIVKTDLEHGAIFKSSTDGKIYAKWHILGQYAVSWGEDILTILEIS